MQNKTLYSHWGYAKQVNSFFIAQFDYFLTPSADIKCGFDWMHFYANRQYKFYLKEWNNCNMWKTIVSSIPYTKLTRIKPKVQQLLTKCSNWNRIQSIFTHCWLVQPWIIDMRDEPIHCFFCTWITGRSQCFFTVTSNKHIPFIFKQTKPPEMAKNRFSSILIAWIWKWSILG